LAVQASKPRGSARVGTQCGTYLSDSQLGIADVVETSGAYKRICLSDLNCTAALSLNFQDGYSDETGNNPSNQGTDDTKDECR